MLASHGTVPWSPAPTSALRGEGRERGAQRDEMPIGSGGSEICCPGWNDSLSGLWACTKYRGHETERGGAGVMKTTQRSSTEPGAGSQERVCELLCFSATAPSEGPSLTRPDKQSSVLVLVR